ncbi:MAG: HYR domain-containing protein [Crocinitomicaceae bacterium]|nr:HYR domain-containing protein [Crocinitomicaceae bacterium]
MRILLAFIVSLPYFVFTQTVEILNEDFEGPTNVWSTTGSSASNQWIINTCAGNGPSAAGSNAVYISKGGPDAGCGTTGDIQYRYDNAASGSEFTIVFTTVDAACLTNLQYTIDYKLIGEGYNGASGPFHDFGTMVYSTDGGTTWQNASNAFYNIPAWSTATLPLPASLNGQSFEFGIMWTFDNSLVNDPPLAMDNIIITGEDNTPPSVTCQGDINIPGNNSCQTTLLDYTSTLTVSDLCTPTPNLTITQSPLPGTILDAASNPHNISFLVEDENGNSNSCSFNLTIVDTTSPSASCPGNQTVYVDNSCSYSIADFSSLLTVSDNCSSIGNLLISQNPPAATILANHGTIQNLDFTVTDEAGNTNQCAFNIILTDSTAPSISCPNDTNIYANASCDATVPDYTGVTVVSDNCTNAGVIAISQSPVAGGILSGLGANQLVTMTADDGLGNTSQCQFTVNLVDTISPSVTCPGTQSVNGDNNCEALVPDFSALVSANDNCSNSINLTYSQLPAIGATVSGPTNIMTITIQDESGNSNSCNFDLDLIDIFPPSVTCPINQTLFLNGVCEASLPDYSGMTVAIDNCLLPGQLNFSQSPVAGTILPGSLGSQLITMTVSDTSGNSNQCQFLVSLSDTISPIISCPSDSTVYVGASCDYTVVNYTGAASAVDNCSAPGNITLSQNLAPGTILAAGTQPVIITGMDEAGNTNTCSFNISALDTISPFFNNCPPNVDINVDQNCQATLIDYTPQATALDNCSGTISYSQTPTAGTVISSNTDVSIVATDASGNTAVCVIRVNLLDTLAPVFTNCPSDQNVAVNAQCEFTMPDYTAITVAADNCTAPFSLVYSQTPAPGTTITGNSMVTITVQDGNGNSADCNFNILVNDNIPPTITTCVTNQTEYVDSSCNYTLPDYTSLVVASDFCSAVSISQSPAPGTNLAAGVQTVYMIAADSAGNLDSCQFDLTVLDTIAPVIVCPLDQQTCDTIITWTSPVISDNCDVPVLTRTDGTGLTSGDVFPIGTTTISYLLVDNSGNSNTCSFDVEVIALPDNATAGLDIDLCVTDTTGLAGNNPTVGTGTWTVVSGSGAIDNPNNPNTTIRNLPYGATILTWQITNSICSSNVDTVVINRWETPSMALVADTIHTCGDTANLSGNLPTIGSGLWTNIFGSGTITQPNSNNAFVSNLFAGENRFVWTISNGNCTSSKDTLVVISTEAPSIIDAGGDQDLCDTTDQINLIALQPDYGMGIWSVVDGNGVLDNDTALSVIVSGINGNPNTLVWTVSKQYCPDQHDTISINYYACIPFNPDIPTAFTPDGDGINDTWEIPDLNKFYPECKVIIVNRWGNTLFESEGYTTPWDGRYRGKDLPLGSYYFVIDFNNGSDEPLSGSVTIIR